MPSNNFSTIALQEREYGLIIHQAAAAQHGLENFLNLLLNYQYGLEVVISDSLDNAAWRMRLYGRRVRCLFFIHTGDIDEERLDNLLAQYPQMPCFVLLPHHLLSLYSHALRTRERVFFTVLEQALGTHPDALPHLVPDIFQQCGIDNLLSDADLPHQALQQSIEQRLNKLHTLPTLPDIVLQIMRLVNDPDSEIGDLTDLLLSDAAIAVKLLQIVNSSTFAGSGHKRDWPLEEAVVRLGLKKVGAIAQQIALMTRLVKPADNPFDLERFWKHSVGCALIANKLYSKKLIHLHHPVEFSDYWLGGLLHDIGKLVLGFFFPRHFATILQERTRPRTSFRQAETQLGNVVNHEHIGRLMVLKSAGGPDLVEAVGAHHTTGANPNDLVCLINLADNLCKDLGLGYAPQDRGVYSSGVLNHLRLATADVLHMRQALGNAVVEEIELLVEQCRTCGKRLNLEALSGNSPSR